MTIPRTSNPTLRSYLGALSSQKTTSTSTNRGLYSLQGGLTENDQAVEDVVNAIVTEVDAMGPTELAVSANGKSDAGVLALYTYLGLASATETVATFDLTSEGAATWLFEVDATCITDDYQDAYAARVARGFIYNGTTAGAIAAQATLFAHETTAAGWAVVLDLSGTTARLRVTTVADYRWTLKVSINRVRF